MVKPIWKFRLKNSDKHKSCKILSLIRITSIEPAERVTIEAYDNKRRLGYARFSCYMEEEQKSSYLNMVEVVSKYRRLGIGDKLIVEGEKILKNKGIQIITTDVSKDNLPVRRLLKKMDIE